MVDLTSMIDSVNQKELSYCLRHHAKAVVRFFNLKEFHPDFVGRPLEIHDGGFWDYEPKPSYPIHYENLPMLLNWYHIKDFGDE